MNPDWRVLGETTSCSGFLGAEATERRVQREVTLWSGFSGVTLLSGVSGQRPERVKGGTLALGEPTNYVK